jgi:arylsulfatase A-like enzyme
VDVQIGRVLDALEKSPCKDNTIAMFLTDHGLYLGEKGHRNIIVKPRKE